MSIYTDKQYWLSFLKKKYENPDSVSDQLKQNIKFFKK